MLLLDYKIINIIWHQESFREEDILSFKCYIVNLISKH